MGTAPASDTADLLGEALGAAPAQAPQPQVKAAAVDLLGMDDLLGGDPVPTDSGIGGYDFNPLDQAPPVAIPQFALAQGVTLSGQQFEGQWGSLPQALSQQKQMRPSSQITTAIVEESLRQRGIH